MKRFVIAIALTCVLSVSAFAGDVPIVPAPTPTQTQTQTSIAATIILTIISLARR